MTDAKYEERALRNEISILRTRLSDVSSRAQHLELEIAHLKELKTRGEILSALKRYVFALGIKEIDGKEIRKDGPQYGYVAIEEPVMIGPGSVCVMQGRSEIPLIVERIVIDNEQAAYFEVQNIQFGNRMISSSWLPIAAKFFGGTLHKLPECWADAPMLDHPILNIGMMVKFELRNISKEPRPMSLILVGYSLD